MLYQFPYTIQMQITRLLEAGQFIAAKKLYDQCVRYYRLDEITQTSKTQ